MSEDKTTEPVSAEDKTGLEQQLKQAQLRLTEAETELKRLEAEYRRLEVGQAHRLSWKSAPIIVAVVASLSAIFFQGLGALTSYLDKSREEQQQTRENQFNALKLFVEQHDDLITCNNKVSQRNIELFEGQLPPSAIDGVRRIVVEKSIECVNNKVAQVEDQAGPKRETSIDAIKAAQQARYSGLSQQSTILNSVDQGGGLRVFIQFGSESDRAVAEQLRVALDSLGYAAPGVDKVGSAPNRFQVRYYVETDADRAITLAQATQKALGLPEQPTLVSLAGRFDSLPKNTMEFWFPSR